MLTSIEAREGMISGEAERDVRGLRVVITGAGSGVGAALARALVTRGAEVILACRSLTRAEPVRAALEPLAPPGRVRSIALDLSDLGSVRSAAAALGSERIDVLVNNAGVGGARGVTRDGLELAFGTNHLGHYLLTRLLLDALAGGRIVHLGSGSYARAPGLDWDALARPTASLTGVREYAASKLAVMLFHDELTRRLVRQGQDTISVVADPGDVASDAYRHVPAPLRALWTRRMKSPERGAETPLRCVVAPSIAPGAYVDGRAFVPAARARDPELALALWARSARWAGLPEEG